MSIVMQLQDVAESTRLGPLSGEVRAGEILHLVGPNGAGKSTLLARMAGMTSGKGSIQFAGQPLEAWSATKLALHRAYLSQQQTPPFAMPVWHYLTLHQHDKTRTELLNDVAGALALDDKLGRSTNQLSGGEWQRVRLAAVVLQITPQANPAGQLLLLDEPMNSLDVAQQSALDKILSALCQQGLAIVMSSHDLNHIASCASGVVAKRWKNAGQWTQRRGAHAGKSGAGLWDEFSPSGYRRSQNADFDHLISLVS